MVSLTASSVKTTACNDTPQNWDEWWKSLWTMKPVGQYSDDYPFASVYFQALMSIPFTDHHCDGYDKKVFDFFIAIEVDDLEMVKDRLDDFDGCYKKNTEIVLMAGLVLAEELQLHKIAGHLKSTLGKRYIPFEKPDKKLEPTLIDLEKAEEDESPSKGATLMKVAFFGLMILGGAAAGYLLLRRGAPQLSNAPYDNGVDSAGIPRPSCDHPEYWPVHEQLIKEKVLSCNSGKALFDRAKIEGSIHGLDNLEVKIVPNDHCLTAACADLNTNKAMVSCSGKEPTSLAVFEIGNLARNSEFRKVDQQVYQGEIKNRDQYAYEVERVEYGTVKDHIEIVNECIKEEGWKKGAKFYNPVPWKDAWKEISNWEHAEYYRRGYDRMIAEPVVFQGGGITSSISKVWYFFFGS